MKPCMCIAVAIVLFITVFAVAQTQSVRIDADQPAQVGIDVLWFDSLNVGYIGSWPYGHACAVQVDSSRMLTFVGTGGSVHIVNVADFTNPTLKSEKIRTRGYVTDLFYERTAQRLYIAACTPGLEIWDVADPSHPNKLGSYELPDKAVAVLVEGSYAYVAAITYGLSIIDISNPSNLTEIGHYDTPQQAVDIFYNDSYIYVADGHGGLRIVDVSTPTNPHEVGHCIPPGYSNSVYVLGIYAYTSNYVFGLRIIDVSNVTNPQEVGYYDPSDYVYNAYVHTNYFANVFAQVATLSGVHTVDVTNPANPVPLQIFSTPSMVIDLDCITYVPIAFIATSTGGLRIAKLTVPAHEYGFYQTPGNMVGLVVDNDYAYTVDYTGLRIFDVKKPDNPKVRGFCSSEGARKVCLSKPYCYVAAGYNGLRIIDVDPPNIPHEVGHCITPGYAMDVAVKDTLAYVAAQSAGLRIINLASLFGPYEITQFNTPDDANGIFVSGDYAYIAENYSGLRIIEISDPLDPKEVGHWPTPHRTFDVHVVEPYAYVADYNHGLRIVDVSDPSNPYEVGYCDTPGYAWEVYVSGNYAYVADASEGVRVIDISEPTNPYEYGFYETPSNAWGAYADEYIYVAASSCGLYVYKLIFPEAEELGHDELSSELVVLQNPVLANHMELKLTTTKTQPYTICLYNAAGQKVQTHTVHRLTPGTHIIKVPTCDIPRGVYFVNVTTGTTSVSDKLLVIR